MTRLAVCVLCIVAISFCASDLWSQSVTEDVVGNITRFEQDSVKADLANDTSFYEKYLADDYTVGSTTGVFETKEEILAEMRDPNNNQCMEGNELISEITLLANCRDCCTLFGITCQAVSHWPC